MVLVAPTNLFAFLFAARGTKQPYTSAPSAHCSCLLAAYRPHIDDDPSPMSPSSPYGDGRDEISRRLQDLGGNADLINESFTNENLHRTRRPAPFSSSTLSGDTTEEAWFSPLDARSPKKISIVGAGQVGLAIAYAVLNQDICSGLALVDMNEEKLQGEARDLQQGSSFFPKRVLIEASSDYDVSADSDLVVVTAGVARREGDSRLDLVQRNVNIMKSIIPQVLEHSPNAPICIVANPCDVMTAVAAKVAGPSVPPGRIFGSGTVLDTGRFCSIIASSLNVASRSVHGYVIGEHGDSSVPVWSSVHVGGVPLLRPDETPNGAHHALHSEVVKAGAEVIKKKGYTNWAIGMSVSHIADVVLHDERQTMPVSTCARGFSGIEEDAFLSLPCIMGSTGIKRVVDLPMRDFEVDALHKSKDKIWEVQSEIWDSI